MSILPFGRKCRKHEPMFEFVGVEGNLRMQYVTHCVHCGAEMEIHFPPDSKPLAPPRDPTK